MWVNPDAAPLLESLRSRRLPLAVVTNSPTRLAEEILSAAGLAPFFHRIACADQVPRAKPAPDLVLHACRGLEVPSSEAWMVGDSRFDREAARTAGAFFVGLGLDGDARLERLGELDYLVAQSSRSKGKE